MELPGSIIVIPYSLFINPIVILLCVTTKNLLFDEIEASFSSSQNFSTLPSSKGASTSSRIQIGDTLFIKVEKIRAKEANAFSPPDIKIIFVIFFLGEIPLVLIRLLKDLQSQ